MMRDFGVDKSVWWKHYAMWYVTIMFGLYYIFFYVHFENEALYEDRSRSKFSIETVMIVNERIT